MNPDETRRAAAARHFGTHGVTLASICFTGGDAMLIAADRPEFFSKLRDGACTFTADDRSEGYVEVANRKVFFRSDQGVVHVMASDEPLLGRSTAKLKKHGERTAVAREAEIATATEAQKRWVR